MPSVRKLKVWLDENCPKEMRDGAGGEENICWGGLNWKFQSDAQKIWLERMAAKGWSVPAWPKEYGGGGLSKEEVKFSKRKCALLARARRLKASASGCLGRRC